jgi:hypothetical protein
MLYLVLQKSISAVRLVHYGGQFRLLIF